MKRMIKLLFVCFLITGCGSSKYTNIDSNEAMKLLENNNTVIIDVRDSDEYETGHIANSVNIPLNDIANIDYSWGEVEFVSRPLEDLSLRCCKADACESNSYLMDIEPDDIDMTDTVTVVWNIS